MKTIIFDFDGTIADNFQFVHDIVARLAPKYGYPREVADEVVKMRDLPLRDIVKKYHISKISVLRMLFDGRREMKKYLLEAKMPDGLAELIKQLIGNGMRVAIISSNSAGNISKFLAQNRIIGNIDIESSIHLFGKSSSIKKYLRMNGIAQKDVVYVGDEVRDIDAAKEAGIQCISVVWGYNTPEILAKHNQFVAKNVVELRAQINQALK